MDKVGISKLYGLVPSLVSPQDGEFIAATETQIGWSTIPGGTSYHLQISTDREFLSVEIEDMITLEATPALEDLWIHYEHIKQLSQHTEYNCRVRAKTDSSDFSDWSHVLTFSTHLHYFLYRNEDLL